MQYVRLDVGLCGATVARLTPDCKVRGSMLTGGTACSAILERISQPLKCTLTSVLQIACRNNVHGIPNMFYEVEWVTNIIINIIVEIT